MIKWRSNVHLNTAFTKAELKKRNEMKIVLHINPGKKEAEISQRVGSSELRGGRGCAVCQSFVCLRQVFLHYQKSCFISSGSRKQQAAVNR